jgi:hypothetical protein
MLLVYLVSENVADAHDALSLGQGHVAVGAASSSH